MATTPFTYSGQQYTIDDQGQVRQVMPDGSEQIPQQMTLALTQAAAAAQAGGVPTASIPTDPTADATAPADTSAGPTIPATPPNPGGLSASASVHQSGTTSTVATPATPTLPASPPRAGVAGSAVELRTERDKVQKQLDELNKSIDPSSGPTSAQSSLIGSLTTRVSGLTSDISKAEATKDKPASVLRTTGSPDDPFNIIDNGDGTISAVPNQNYTGQVKPQVVTHGNHTFVITPPTKEELAANPAAAPHTTVAYTDTDAQQLAQRTADNAAAQTRVAAAAQATNDFAARAKAEIDDRVSKGEDAASVRAELTRQAEDLHRQWVESDGDARRAQTALDSYNTSRHNIASENLTQAQIDATAAAQARQDATQRYGYDTSAATSRYATDSAAQTAKLNAANQFMGNVLTQLGEINKALPPGSDLAGRALEGLLKYGANFMKDFAGPNPTPGGPPIGGAPAPDANTPPLSVTDTTPVATDTTPPDASPSPVPQPITVPSPVLGSRGLGGEAAGGPGPNAPMAPDFAAASIGDPSRGPDPAQLAAAFGGTGDALAAQNAAAHAATMRAPVNTMSPDGTPWASSLDVARVFGRGGNG